MIEFHSKSLWVRVENKAKRYTYSHQSDRRHGSGKVRGFRTALTVTVERTGEERYLSQVLKLISEAQESKSKTKNLSDRSAKWLFYLALVVGIVTLITWLEPGYGYEFAMERMVTVMIIACPHALGLAVPFVVSNSTSIAAKKGLLIRNSLMKRPVR